MFTWLKRLFFRGSPPANSGEAGERLAAEFLRKTKGFVVVERNWRNPSDLRDELDLICRDGSMLVFVEVKTRAAGALVPGYYAIDRRKKKVLRRTAAVYLRQLKTRPRTFRLDVVEVTTGPGPIPTVIHFENIPLFSKHFQP